MTRPSDHIEPFDDGVPLHERGNDDEHDGGDVENQKAIAKPVGAAAVALVERSQIRNQAHGRAAKKSIWRGKKTSMK